MEMVASKMNELRRPSGPAVIERVTEREPGFVWLTDRGAFPEHYLAGSP
jgi:hypothetical protein